MRTERQITGLRPADSCNCGRTDALTLKMASEEKDANAIKSGNISSSIRLGVHVVEDEYNSDENMDVLYTANRDGRNSEEVNFHFEATNVAPCAAGGDDGEGEEQVDIFRLIGGDVSEEESDYDEHISEEEDEEKMKEYSLRDMGTGVEDDIRGSSGEEEMAVDAEESGQADGRNDALEVPSDGGLNFSTMIPVEKKEVSGQRYFPLASFMEEEEEEEDSLTGEETKSSRQIVRAPLLAQASSKSRGDTAKNNGDCEADVLFGFVLDNVLSSEECAALIDTAEMISDDEDVADCSFTFWNKDCKTEAEVSASRAYRNVDTIEFCHSPFAVELWRRIAPFLTKEYARIDLTKGGASGDPRWQPDVAGVWEAFGTNEHLLLGRYGSGGHFAPHTDGYNIVDFNTRSMLSIVLYLNECASGGGAIRDFTVTDFVRS
eukprot:g4083.t1